METSPPRHVVFMGVSGSGKSTLAREVQQLTGWDFAEGDDVHSPAARQKMAAGLPLNDEDRWPWLQALARWLSDRDAAGRSTLMSCSALRRSYRDVLRGGAPGRVLFVHLVGAADILLERMQAREHFMPPELLQSQLDTLEPLLDDEIGLAIEAEDRPPRELAELVVRELGLPIGRSASREENGRADRI